jgi:hypothetical protein
MGDFKEKLTEIYTKDNLTLRDILLLKCSFAVGEKGTQKLTETGLFDNLEDYGLELDRSLASFLYKGKGRPLNYKTIDLAIKLMLGAPYSQIKKVEVEKRKEQYVGEVTIKSPDNPYYKQGKRRAATAALTMLERARDKISTDDLAVVETYKLLAPIVENIFEAKVQQMIPPQGLPSTTILYIPSSLNLEEVKSYQCSKCRWVVTDNNNNLCPFCGGSFEEIPSYRCLNGHALPPPVLLLVIVKGMLGRGRVRNCPKCGVNIESTLQEVLRKSLISSEIFFIAYRELILPAEKSEERLKWLNSWLGSREEELGLPQSTKIHRKRKVSLPSELTVGDSINHDTDNFATVEGNKRVSAHLSMEERQDLMTIIQDYFGTFDRWPEVEETISLIEESFEREISAAEASRIVEQAKKEFHKQID